MARRKKNTPIASSDSRALLVTDPDSKDFDWSITGFLTRMAAERAKNRATALEVPPPSGTRPERRSRSAVAGSSRSSSSNNSEALANGCRGSQVGSTSQQPSERQLDQSGQRDGRNESDASIQTSLVTDSGRPGSLQESWWGFDDSVETIAYTPLERGVDQIEQDDRNGETPEKNRLARG